MRLASRLRDSLLAAGVIATVAGCGATSSGSTSATSTQTPSPAHASISGDVSVTGQFVLSATFTARPLVETAGLQTPAPPSETCAAWAQGYPQDATRGGGRGFDAPAAEWQTSQSSLYVTVTMPRGYNGPGSYTSSQEPGLTGSAEIGTGTAEGMSLYGFHSHEGMTQLTVHADGSGSVTFAGWPDDETRGGHGTGDIDGTITWSCR